MSAHLQFGPEWMRKGPGKTSTSATSATNEVTSPVQESESHPTAAGSGAGGNKGGPGAGSNRRNPSLGNLSTSGASSGSAPLTPAVTTPSPGVFSFAAAAQGGGSGPGGAGNAHTSSPSSSAAPHSSEGDSVRYSKRLLSLYSSERGGKAPTGSVVEAQLSPNPATGQRKKQPPTLNSGGGASSSDRDSRRSASVAVDAVNVPRSHSPNGEPRGLNARTTSSSHEKAGGHRPGLFQRGSSSTNIAGPALSPTTFQSREARDRHGTGIQGGVLSGVAGPPAARKRKDSEPGADPLRSPRTPLDADHQWEQRRTNDAFTSARNRSSRTIHDDAGTVTSTALPSGAEVIETWSRFGGRKERLVGEGPIGPPADHSGGFAKFAGYDRKRERQASMAGPKRSTEAASDGFNGKRLDEGAGRGGQGSSSDADLSKHATYVLDSLRLDDDDDEAGRLEGQQSDRLSMPATDWTPERQDWLYRDPSGQVQGPFKANMMQEWYAAGYFVNDLLVRRAEDEEFEKLGDKLEVIGNVNNPFLIPPTAYATKTVESSKAAFPEEPQPGGPVQDHFGGMLMNQQVANPVNNSLAWPGNLDVLNHFGGGHSSGHSSPFATPQGHFAELDNHNRLRQRTQQEQYVEMLRQKELADQRAFQEQRAAQMAAIAMAQAHGRDPAALGLWGPGAMLGGEWNQPQPSPVFGSGEGHGHQQLQGDGYHNVQPAWDQPHYAPVREAEPPVAEQEYVYEQPRDVAEEARDDGEDMQALQQPDALPDPEPEPVVDEPESKGREAETVEEEQAPEQVWPQSPTAVEFASEPFVTEEQWSKEESPTRGKKSRRERAKQKVDEEGRQERQQPIREAGFSSGNVKTVGEEQFRRSQTGGQDSTSATLAPLSALLPDTPALATPTKTAPWANSQEGSAHGLSLREIQEAEARQAEARKASRLRSQANLPSSLVPSSEAALPATMSWGLASSVPQAANGRESANTPAWNAHQAPKKTLMEIQEEERKRAQKVKEAQAAQMAARGKGYADSASKMQSSPATSTAGSTTGSWSVVGASGKPTASGATPVPAPAPVGLNRAVRPAAAPMTQRTASSSSIGNQQAWHTPSSANANGPTPTAAAKAQTPRKAGSSASDPCPAPSPEFVKHCKEQLKGLSVKVDDFIEMLFSFPLDPSPEVVEIIAESVYASSSTLDGRRFAADFVAKRKLDASQNRGSSTPHAKPAGLSHTLGNGQPQPRSTNRSASDVLKSSPSGDAFGGFKVVKAKGAKKRT